MSEDTKRRAAFCVTVLGCTLMILPVANNLGDPFLVVGACLGSFLLGGMVVAEFALQPAIELLKRARDIINKEHGNEGE